MFKSVEIWPNFRTKRYAVLNKLRWDAFLATGLSLKGKTVFEPGAGVGDQTKWLLKQGIKWVIVNDGRPENLHIIWERFHTNPRVSRYLHGNLENCLDTPDFQFTVDFIFLWGVYYHLNDTFDFQILRQLSCIGPTIAFDYLEGDDTTEQYGFDNPGVAVSLSGIRPTTPTLMQALKEIWGYAYLPMTQLDWYDELAPNTPRRIVVASKTPLNNPQLILQ